MNIIVKHNGTTITGFVESYERTHKICTGIGTLDIFIVDTVNRTFEPWDSIDIWENGDFKVRYYISSIDHNISRGTYQISCQDNSKRLVDYFIPQSYTIDYPSYNRYWIELFLEEAGVSYEFTTSSQGTLLSNFTQLGLVTVYEQVQTLLQMSGWYMYFDGNGKAIIGSLSIDLAADTDSVGKTDILNISVESNDKMLRNKALVFGAYDPYTGTNAKASVSVRTPWNYDHRDLRTVVISNSNIPNNSTAYGMANQIVKEFARITVEKHISIWGARDFNLGTALRVRANVWRGRGLVTTFGVSMSKMGLITNVVLDERCPRLFGFFDYGDYVYVAFYGDGVWRKHIKFDPTWYNFSTGLTNLNITDLHVNHGIFGAVGHSGQMYYTNTNSGPWSVIATPTSLESSLDNVVTVSGATLVPFSGIMARATIIDKEFNTVKFAVDTHSGLNMGDYFLTYSGLFMESTASGIRSWILEYDPYTGSLVGGLGSGIYPVFLSGNYNMRALDLENDGLNDYISVQEGSGDSIANDGINFNYGAWLNQPYARTRDYDTFTIYPQDSSALHKDINNSASTSVGLRTSQANALIAVDNALSGKRYAFAIGKDGKARKWTVTRTFDEFDNRWEVSGNTQTSATAFSDLIGTLILGIHPDHNADNVFRIYFAVVNVFGSADYKYVDYNASTDSWGSSTLITNDAIAPASGTSITASNTQCIVVDGMIYVMRYYVEHDSFISGDTYSVASGLHVYMIKINMSTSAGTVDHLLQLFTPEYMTGKWAWFPGSSHGIGGHESLGTFGRTTFGLFQDGNGVKIIGWSEVYFVFSGTTHDWEYVFAGNDTVLQYNIIYDDDAYRMPDSGGLIGQVRLTENRGIVGRTATSSSNLSFVFDGTIFHTYTGVTSTPVYWSESNVFPMFVAGNDKYIVLSGSDYYVYDAATLSTTGTLLTLPTDFISFIKPYSTPIGTFGTQVYFAMRDPNFDRCLVRFDLNTLAFDISDYLVPQNVSLDSTNGISFGSFFISKPTNYNGVDPLSEVIYVDMGLPMVTSRFLVLQREGSDYNLIQESAKPIRVDISNGRPVLTVLDMENTFISNYVYDTELVVISPTTGSGVQVNDYRYTLLEPSVGGVPASGFAAESTLLYVYGSGIIGTDVLSYSGGFSQIYSVPSGHGTRIETSNYGMNGQYIFITTSGISVSGGQGFWQQDPAGYIFNPYFNGFPQSRATIIRLDDVI